MENVLSGVGNFWAFWNELITILDVFVEGYHDFIVDARAQPLKMGDEEVKVVIVAPSGRKTAAKVKPNGDATYDVGYVVKEVGKWRTIA